MTPLALAAGLYLLGLAVGYFTGRMHGRYRRSRRRWFV